MRALWSLLLVCVQSEGSVLELTDATFAAERKQHPHLLVLFYAPWCGHCRQLVPDFERAAGFLKTATPPVQLAKVDSTAEMQLSEEHSVRGYPTLKFFTEDRVIDYSGGRTAESMVGWVTKKVGPAAHVLQAGELAEFRKNHPTCLIAYAENTEQLDAYMKVARATEEIVFAYTLSPEAASAIKLVRPGVQMHFPHDAQVATYEASIDDESQLHAFIGTYRLPMVVGFNGDVAPLLFADSRPLLFLFTKESSDSSRTAEEEELSKAAPGLLGKVLMSTAGTFEPMDQRLMDYIGVDPEDVPTVRLVQDPSGAMRKFKMSEPVTADGIAKFVQAYFDGKLSPHLRSAPVPEKNDGPVVEVVGSTFQKIVLESEKDVLVFFYAPWCGHCKKLEPVYKELAQKHAGVDSLLFAKLDATVNDVDGVDLTGFPTVYLYRGNSKGGAPLDYEGDRTVAAMTQWLRDVGGVDVKDEL